MSSKNKHFACWLSFLQHYRSLDRLYSSILCLQTNRQLLPTVHDWDYGPHRNVQLPSNQWQPSQQPKVPRQCFVLLPSPIKSFLPSQIFRLHPPGGGILLRRVLCLSWPGLLRASLCLETIIMPLKKLTAYRADPGQPPRRLLLRRRQRQFHAGRPVQGREQQRGHRGLHHDTSVKWGHNN